MTVLLALIPVVGWGQFGTMSPLHVSGTQLQDEQGNQVVLHGDPYSWIGIKKVDGENHLYVYRLAYDSNAEYEKDCGVVNSDVVYLQARASFGTSKVAYYYSTDNVTYERAASVSFEMRYLVSIFVGQRFYLFNYATKAEGGYVDIDWFGTEQSFTEETYYSPEKLQTYSAEDLAFDHLQGISEATPTQR